MSVRKRSARRIRRWWTRRAWRRIVHVGQWRWRSRKVSLTDERWRLNTGTEVTMGMDSQLSSVRRSSEIEECVIIREYAQREREGERDDAQASNRERKRLLLFFLLVSPTSCWRRDTIITVLFSLSLFLYIQGNDGWSHCVERSKEREREGARAGEHTLLFF